MPVPVAGQHVTKRVVSYAEIRDRQAVRQKWDYTCGAAALATILRYQHQRPVTEKDIVDTLLSIGNLSQIAQRQGFSLLDLKKYVTQVGLQGAGYAELSLQDLHEFGVPAIVPVNLAGFHHFVVFRDIAGDRVVISDPAWGNKTLSKAEFETAWQGNIGFIVLPEGDEPPANHLAASDEELLIVNKRSLLNTRELGFANRTARPMPQMLMGNVTRAVVPESQVLPGF